MKAQIQRLVSQNHMLICLSTLGIVLTSLLKLFMIKIGPIGSIYYDFPKLLVTQRKRFFEALLFNCDLDWSEIF